MNHTTHKKKPISILVVEDSITQVEVIRFFLESCNYTVAVCHDGQEAYEWLQKSKKLPDVIVSDVMMPRMDGYELCKAIRADEKLAKIPLILLTSLSEPHDIIKSIEAGANKFLTKPFDQKRLPEVIDELYINTQRRNVEKMEMGIRLMFGGNDFLITADKVQILDLLLSSYEDSYYKNLQLQETRSELEKLNAELEEKVQERTKELRKLTQAVEQSPSSIIITDREGNIEYVNAVFTQTSGYSQTDVIGKNLRQIESDQMTNAAYDEMWAHVTGGNLWQQELMNRGRDGAECIESVKISPITQKDGKISNCMVIKEDVTEKKRSEERIHYLANFDILTGLPNRALLEDRIKYAIDIAKLHNEELAVISLDIDHFKDINDTLGHHVGDILLIDLAKRFQSILREEDAVSRLSGDAFIFMVSHTNLQGIIHVVQKLLDTIATPLTIEFNELTVTASIGIAIYPMDGTDQGTLTKNADAAMYQAKQEGRNSYRFFTQALQERSARNLQLSNALQRALERDQLYVVYQPQISLSDDRVIGAEALLRWNHPELGNIPPAEFIPLAEETGLILPIGEWVLRTAVSETKRWSESGLPPMVIAVNLSAVQFRYPSLPELVTKILEEVGLSADFLELELTEAAAMHDPQRAISIMNRLHELGIRMSIDDFGTGYSSLSYLKQFKVYKLKIDQSFICDLSTDQDDKAIVSAVISMAHGLGLQTIAEGVETEEQLRYLREQGCDEIQGYYYSKPLRNEEFEEFVRGRSRE